MHTKDLPRYRASIKFSGVLAIALAVSLFGLISTSFAANYTLVPRSTSATPGAQVTVDWTAPANSSAKDWLGWFKTGVPNSSYDPPRWRYTGGAASGSYTITAPDTPGSYEFRYLINDSYTPTAISQTVTVTLASVTLTVPPTIPPTIPSTNPTTYALQANPPAVQAGQKIALTWSAPGGRLAKDWIGLFKVGVDNTAFDPSRWIYTNAATAGTYEVTAPSASGNYEFRYLLNDGYVKAANSNAVTVTGPSADPRVTLSANPAVINAGQSTLLSWTGENVSTCTATGSWSGTKNLSDSQTVFPTTNSTYTLTCSGAKGSASQSATVTVNAASTANVYYVSTVGDDRNPGTLGAPFASLRKAVSVLKPGDTLLVRGGEYDTVNGLTRDGANSAIPSGLSWNQPVTIKAYPGEQPTFRRYLPAGSAPEDLVAKSIHLATYQECVNWAQARWGAGWRAFFKTYPYDCWTGSGSANDGLYYQAPYGFVGGAIITMFNDVGNPAQYIIFDGINFDARGIVQNNVQLYSGAQHIRFINSLIQNAIGSCVTQPGVSDSSLMTDLQFIQVKIHHCGVPYDTNLIDGIPARKSPYARFFHPWYMHTGGNLLESSEVYESAGTGLGPDGGNNVIRGNYIHDNAGQGIYIAGGDQWLVEYNIFRNNGGPGIYHQNGGQHTIRHNTVVQDSQVTVATPYGVLLAEASRSTIYENNIVAGYQNSVWNNSTSQAANTLRNNLIKANSPNREVTTSNGSVPLIMQSNILGRDPQFIGIGDFRLQAGSPASGTATDGGNIGAQ